MSADPVSAPVGTAVWTAILLSIIEVWFMFPFENKGDFAEIGRYVVNAIGSGAYMLKLVVVAMAMPAVWRAARQGWRRAAMLFAAVCTPLLIWAIQGIVQP